MDHWPRLSLLGLPSSSNSLDLPECPANWLVLCASRALDRGPVSREVCGRQLVGFRTNSGQVAVLDARCVHMGSNLAGGRVVGETIRCPFHHWQFGVDGRCQHIPATDDKIPAFARQRAYAVREQHGSVFFWNGDEPEYELPFFDDVSGDELVRAEPFALELDCPWYMVGANGVDVQHFRATHGRRMLSPPRIETPHAQAHRATTRFAVVGTSMWDRITRLFAGPEVTMRVTDWGGTLFFVEATFRRTQTFGMVALLPLERARTRVFVTVAVKKGLGLVDHLNARVRRRFVHEFLAADVARSAGTDVRLATLIDADQALKDYFAWLQQRYAPKKERENLAGCARRSDTARLISQRS
jgi:phenylpropionate dioxygenase-like ring-hydroxylating dioxygenase large terminal subunit